MCDLQNLDSTEGITCLVLYPQLPPPRRTANETFPGIDTSIVTNYNNIGRGTRMNFSEAKGVPGVVRTGKRGGSRKVNLFRTVAVLVLAASTICLSTIGYALSKNKEKKDFLSDVSESK